MLLLRLLSMPVAGLLLVPCAAAADSADGKEEGTRVRAVLADRLVDVTSGTMKRDQVILIRSERIVAVGSKAEVHIPPEAEKIDLGAATVLPGLIDAHVHLTSSHKYHGYTRLGISLPRSAVIGAANARKTLMAGFTTVRDVGAVGFADVAVRDAINEGELVGPRMRVAGTALGITGGHCDENLLPAEFNHRSGGVADGPWAVRAKVREVKKYGADVIKFCGTGGVLSKGTQIGVQQYTLEEMKAIVDEAHLQGMKVAVHAHGTRGIKSAIEAGVDSVEHASLIDDEGIRMARRNGTYLSMDIYVSDFILSAGKEVGILEESLAKEREVGRLQRENFAKAVKAGVKIVFGSDAGVYPHGDNARQFAYMVRYGMSPMQAVQAATTNAAELLGMSSDVGSLAPGKYADIIAVRGNPLEDIRTLEGVAFVMKGGEIIVDRISQ